MRIASIDCGTNTVTFLVVDVKKEDPASFHIVEDKVEYTKLGEGLDRNGFLLEMSIKRSLDAIFGYFQRAHALGVQKVIAFATEAVRLASNGAVFLEKAKTLGCPISLLSGKEEARFVSLAVSHSLPSKQIFRSVLDIGGGSTQLCLLEKDTILACASVPLGVVVLSERYLQSDPPTQEETKRMTAEIDKHLDMLPVVQGELIGVSGSLLALGCLEFALPLFDKSFLHGKSLSKDQVLALRNRLANLSLSERKQWPGMDVKRADSMYAGACILSQLMLKHDSPSLTLCTENGRLGTIIDWVKNNPIQ